MGKRGPAQAIRLIAPAFAVMPPSSALPKLSPHLFTPFF